MANDRALRTAREIAARRAFGESRRRRKRLPRQVYPKGVQRDYARALIRLVRQSREELQPLIDALPMLAQTAQVDRARFDAGEGKRIAELVALAQGSLAGAIDVPVLERLAQQFATKTQTWQRVQMAKETRAALGVDVFAGDEGLAAAAEAFTAENVALIKDLPTRTYGEIERLVQREVQAGAMHKDIAKLIQQRFRIAENRAKLIARDQVGKYYGKVTEVRQRALGVEKFIWRTANDERVRPEHEARDGVIYTWANAPEGGPGQPVNCRCYAEPVLDDIGG